MHRRESALHDLLLSMQPMYVLGDEGNRNVSTIGNRTNDRGCYWENVLVSAVPCW